MSVLHTSLPRALIAITMLFAGLLVAAVLPALGQDEEQQRSRFLAYVEEQLSGPGRIIRLDGIEGALSSNATIASITIADDTGVWLAIEGVAIEWNRSALLRGRLEVDVLRAQRLEVSRAPVPADGLPTPEAGRFALPDLPVAIQIGTLEIDTINLGEPLFGLAAQLTGNGSLSLEDGSLETQLSVTRRDGPGGTLSLDASFAAGGERLEIDLSLSEPADGVVANLLNLEGRPPVSLQVQGGGPLDALDVQLALDTDAGRVVSGQLVTSEQPSGLAFTTALEGPISALVAPAYRGFFGAQSTINAQGVVLQAGGLELNELSVESGALSLNGSLTTAPDGFPTRLQLDAQLRGDGSASVLLPVPGQTTRAGTGRLVVGYGLDNQTNGGWSAQLRLDDLQAGDLYVGEVALDMRGTATSLGDRQDRAITLDGDGYARGFAANSAAIASALGDAVTLSMAGDWRAGDPIRIDRFALRGNGLSASARGQMDALVFDGDLSASVTSLGPFAALAGTGLDGALDLEARGTVDLLSGGFDLLLDAQARALVSGDAPLDAVLAGDVTLAGELQRGSEGLRADALQLESQTITALLDGTLSSAASDLSLRATLADLGVLSQRARGEAQLSAQVSGQDRDLVLVAQLEVPQGRLLDQALSDGLLGFEGVAREGVITGAAQISGQLGGAPVRGSAEMVLGERERSLANLVLDADGATLSGGLRQSVATGLLEGTLDLRASSIRTLGLLVLQQAAGALDATLVLTPDGQHQGLSVRGTASGVSINGARVGAARFDLAADDVLGERTVPNVRGTLVGEQLALADVSVSRLDVSSQPAGRFLLNAEGIRAPQLDAARLGPARLRAEGSHDGQAIALSSATLETGSAGASVQASASGRIPLSGGGLALDLRGTVPLVLAEPFLADRGVQLSGAALVNASVSGSLDQPALAGSVRVENGQIVDPGLGLRVSALVLDARLSGQEAIVEQASAQISGGGTISLAGRIGLTDNLPADLRIALRQARYADGTLLVTTADGDLILTGPLTSGPLLAGAVRLLETNITIPDSFGGAGGLLDVEHINPSQRVRSTFERARAASRAHGGQANSPGMRLDLSLSAPNQIYVRGRGVTAELGGAVRLTGTVNDVVPVGSFDLIRGRVDILGQRVVLSTGSITLVGDLDPLINLEATTQSDDIDVMIAVRGRVSDPTVTLSSQPELPQDEVLARLIFNRSLNELSPLQIGQLALAAAELAGGGNGSLLGDLRAGLGVSDIDIVTDGAGNPAVRAGQYVQENVYVGVEASTAGSARTTINLDITEDFTARGAVASDGESSIGIFFERDY